MNRTGLWTAAAVLVASTITGCDWEGGSDAETISGRYGWVNFSGVYRGSQGGILVTDYTQTADTPATTNRVANERVATAVAGQSVYSGNLRQAGITAGSLTIVAGVYVLTDNGSGGLAGSGRTGTINYGSGAWSINLAGAWPPAGTQITATYTYYLSGTKGTTGADAGTSGKPIYAFTVQQDGNSLSILDNNGATYNGKISSIRSTGGASQDLPDSASAPVTGDQLIGSFEASGQSAAGVEVKMVGTLQGTVGGASDTGITLTDRAMYGTWIESGTGKTGDINGSASPITVSTGGGTGG